MATRYIWQHDEWPNLHWDVQKLSSLLAEVNMLRGQLLGRLHMLDSNIKDNSMLDALTLEIVNSSEIEGEILNRDSVRSSVARQLGLEDGGLIHEDHYVEGIVQVMLDATQRYELPLDSERIFGWHAALFPNGHSGAYKITVAQWRNGEEPMQVVSGAFGRQKVHFEAPPSNAVEAMMNDFLQWVENRDQNIDPIIKAALAHLWFVTIHPFDDGNGRICRTITEMLLSRADKTNQRYYSMSSAIIKRRSEYYDILEKTQGGNTDVTNWIECFLVMLKSAIEESILKTENVIRKTRFWDLHRDIAINERQRKVINMLFDGFEGKLNSSKWYKINHCSQDTATRDINDLVQKGILRSSGEGGRSTNYILRE